MGILGGDGQGKQGSSQVLFKQGKRWCNGDLTKGLVGDRENGERGYLLTVFTCWALVMEARFKERRTRWFFMQREVDTWHSLPEDKCGCASSKGDWATNWQKCIAD